MARHVQPARRETSPWATSAGDRDLVAGASELLCFRVDFPIEPESQNQYQDSSVTLDLTFSAEQTANNP